MLAWLHRRPDDVAHAVEMTMRTLQAVLARTIREGKGVGRCSPRDPSDSKQTSRILPGSLKL